MTENHILLSAPEVRVLGCLLEKEMATPDYYPLTLNALVNACNQKTNREPVVAYDEAEVLAATEGLREKRLIRTSNVGRAQKFEQIFSDERKLIPQEKAAVCMLLLRGPQTIGEIRGRTDRLCTFADLDGVRATLENLEEMGLVKRLPLQPGRKEARYAHLLAGEPLQDETSSEHDAAAGQPQAGASAARIAELEEQMLSMREELDQLRQELAQFKAQFD